MEFEEAKLVLETVNIKLEGLLNWYINGNVQPDYNALAYSKQGVWNLFNELKKVASHSDYLQTQLRTCEFQIAQVKAVVTRAKNYYDFKVSEYMQKNGKTFINNGYAANERLSLSLISLGEEYKAYKDLEVELATIVEQIIVINGYARILNDFKYVAESMTKLINLGSLLKELS